MQPELYEPGEEFSAIGDIITVGPLTTSTLLTRESTKVGQIFIDRLLLFVQAGSEDQIYFSFHRDGHAISPFNNFNGGLIINNTSIAVMTQYPPGVFEIRARNISGINVKAQAGWIGKMLREKVQMSDFRFNTPV